MSDSEQIDQPETERGSVSAHTEPRFLVIGQVTKPHGVRGEVRAMPQTDLPERFTWLEQVYLGEEAEQPVAVVSARLHKGFVLLKLVGYNDREAAEGLRGVALCIPVSEAVPLSEGEYYLRDLLGLTVLTDTGEVLGTIADVIETGANNVFVVRGERELLIPDIPDVVLDIDFDKGQVTIQPMPGLLTS